MPTSNILRFLEKPKPEEITCNTINAGIYVLEPETFDRIPDGRRLVDRAQLLSVVHRARRDVSGVDLPRLLDRHRHAREVHAGAPRHHGRALLDAAVQRRARHGVGLADGARRCRARASKGRCSSMRAASSKPAPASALTRCSGKNCQVDEDANVSGAIVWADSRIGREAHVTDTIIGRSGQIGRNAQLQRRRAWRHDVHRRIQPPMNPNIFKAYDVRGLYPAELDEQMFHQIGRAFVAYLKAKRIGVGRDMRLSSPSLAAAFIAGAREQGADVVDYGMIATDMIYYAVATDDLDGGAQITASHNPKQYNGCKMVGPRQSCRSAATAAFRTSAT